MEPIVLAFSGRMGSGKSTISKYVADALGWKKASFGEYIRSFAKAQGLEPSREVLQELGELLVNRGPEDFCRSLLLHYQWSSGEPLVIEGVRHVAVLRALQKLVAPLALRLVHIELSEKTRRERLERTDKDVLARLDDIESHSTELEVGSTLPTWASWRVEGERPVEELVREIVSWVHQGDGAQNTCDA
jgi:dephospho-CoA kinase